MGSTSNRPCAVVNDCCPSLVKRCWDDIVRTSRSRELHALNGNTSSTLSTLWMASFNSDGLFRPGRWNTLLSYEYDILCLQETHLTAAKQQVLSTTSSSLHCLWGAPVTENSRCGVGIVVNSSKFAMVTPIRWANNHPCHGFWQSGRLQAVMLHFHDASAMVLYNVYGPAGARESAAPKRALRQLLNEVTADAATRALPAMLVGDFNAELEATPFMQTLVETYWLDIACLTEGPPRATCHKGSGSRIDHAWCSGVCYPMVLHFDLQSNPFTENGHDIIEIGLRNSFRAVSRFSPRSSCAFDHLQVPESQVPCHMPQDFFQALAHSDVDAAASVWSRVAERVLINIHNQQDGSLIRIGQPRGKVQFDNTRQLPHVAHQHADSLQLRRFGQAYRRAAEITKAAIGTRAARTWNNMKRIIPECPDPWQHELRGLLQRSPSHNNAHEVMKLIGRVMQHLENQQRSHRLKIWKQQMRGSASKSSSWRKKQQALAENPYLRDHRHYSSIIMKVDGKYTIDPSRQLQAVVSAWDEVFGKHRRNPPGTWTFLQHYGPFLSSRRCDLPPLTQGDLLRTVQTLKASAAGLDGWRPQDLRLLGRACPGLYVHLAELMNVCEGSSTWPSSWTVGYVAMLPKNLNLQGQVENAMDMRPITVLSALYRCWSRTRCRQMKPWLLSILPNEVCALRSGQGADDMAVDVSYLLEQAEMADEWSGGLSYDFAKCYDHIVPAMAIDVLLYRGASVNVVQGLRGFYKAHSKHFKLSRACSRAYKPCNGLIQGDPLSNFLLASMIAAWVERLSSGQFGQARVRLKPRVYVDDISATVISNDLQQLQACMRNTHDSVQHFAELTGGLLNHGKCFTYGVSEIANTVQQIRHHKETFRLVGGSITCGESTSWTPLIQKRVDGWIASATACGQLPLGWKARSHAQQQLMSKLTWGQGTHTLHIPTSRLSTMRATMARALLRVRYYSVTPMALFTLVAIPTLEPLFAIQFASLRVIQRFCAQEEQRQYLINNLESAPCQQKGPLARARQLWADPIYKEAVQFILRASTRDRSWEHALRDKWREHHWEKIARLRGSFEGIQRADRKLATAFLDELHTQSDGFQQLLDRGSPGPHLQQDPRPRSKILLYLLTGGLLCPSRDGRHRHNNVVQCSVCGVPDEVQHIHWHCEKYSSLRAPIRHLLQRISRSPMCFQYATIPTVNMRFTAAEVKLIQRVLVDIWQQHVREWYDADVDNWNPPDDPAAGNGERNGSRHGEAPADQPSTSGPSAATASDPAPADREQRGHLIRFHGTGAFCVKCGLQTSRLEHVRLKITRNKCPYENLPRDSWMETPGKIHSKARLDEQEKNLNEKYNTPGHRLVWNRKTGKDPQQKSTFGWLWCRTCGRSFAWRYRTNNLPKTRCQPLQFPPTAPSWVQEIDAANRDGGQDQDNVSQDTSSNNRSQRPRFRLRSKTNAASSTSMPVHVSQASSSSTSMPVSGTLHNQTSCQFPRKGIG